MKRKLLAAYPALPCLVVCIFLVACGGGSTGLDLMPSTNALSVKGLVRAAAVSSSATAGIVVNAGPGQAVEPLSTVTLSASLSSATSPTGVSFAWSQTAGPSVTLINANTANPSFVAPVDKPGTLMTFAVFAKVGGAVATNSVSVTLLRDNPWGVAPSATLTRAPATWAPSMAQAGVAGVRNFDPTLTADRLKPLTDAGMTATGILQWSSLSPMSLPVNDLAGWRSYVTGMVTRYKGRVRHWEVWNEPPNFTVDQSPASYGAIVAAAYDAAKAADPNVQVGLAAKSNHVNYLAQSIEAGAANKFDFITLHPYENAGLLGQGWEGQFISIAPRVRAMLLDKNPGKANVPLWFTEVGIPVVTPTSAGVSPQVQADTLVKVYTLSLAQGVARVYWFEPRDSEGLYLGLTAGDASLRPSYIALRTLSARLGTRPSYQGWIKPGSAYYGFVFSSPQGTVLCAWSPPGQVATLQAASTVTVVDPRTGATRSAASIAVTNVPVLLVAPTGSAQSQLWLQAATANTGKVFQWSGDPSAVTSVSLTAGSPSQGVYMVSAPAATVVNGVAEFNLQGLGGATFTVDPAFLSYTTTPIRITAVLRALGTGDPGFNLKYESNAPLSQSDGNGLVGSSQGWHRVASTNFYENTWTLPNPRFVGLYGYNFTFDSDGPSHSQFSIQKITVSK